MTKFALAVFFSVIFLIGNLFPYEKVYDTPQNALLKSFPTLVATENISLSVTGNQIAAFEKELGLKIHLEQMTLMRLTDSEQNLLGYSWVINELGKYFPITLFIALTPEQKVKEVKVLVYREQIGSQVRRRRFLKQFKNKTLQDPLEVDYDIDGISGATISSWSVASAVKKALLLTQAVNPHEKKSSPTRHH